MLELLKAVESTFHRHSLRISEVCAHATQHLAYVAIANMEKAKVCAHCWASRHSKGFEEKNLGSSPGLLGQ